MRTVKDDDKINQYIEWTMNLSEIEVKILAIVAETGEAGITRKQIWLKLGNSENPREVSRKADFFRLTNMGREYIDFVSNDIQEI